MSESKQAPKRDTVTLKKPHRHARQNKPAGATIDVTPARRAWLEKQGII